MEPGRTVLFEGTGEEFVEYDQSDGLEECHVPRRKPDHVFGLARTPSLDLYARAESLRGLRHSPFSNIDLIYPFLICEAKSEGRGPGFESIEVQTAFPIRACLKLQEDLRQRSGVPLNPFVWFMSYQGDEWRVAACMIHAEQYVSVSSESCYFRKLMQAVFKANNRPLDGKNNVPRWSPAAAPYSRLDLRMGPRRLSIRDFLLPCWWERQPSQRQSSPCITSSNICEPILHTGTTI
jgi:hypothetical protein